MRRGRCGEPLLAGQTGGWAGRGAGGWECERTAAAHLAAGTAERRAARLGEALARFTVLPARVPPLPTRAAQGKLAAKAQEGEELAAAKEALRTRLRAMEGKIIKVWAGRKGHLGLTSSVRSQEPAA